MDARAPQKDPPTLRFESTAAIRRLLQDALCCLEEGEVLEHRNSEAIEGNKANSKVEGGGDGTLYLKSRRSAESLKLSREELRQQSKGRDGDLVPYTMLRDGCCLLRARNMTKRDSKDQGPWLHLILRDTKLHLPHPPVREKSPELLARLQKLQEDLEWKQYNELVKDVDISVARGSELPFLATFRQQAAFGLNVVTLMVTGYVVGHVAMASLYKEEKHLHPFGGVLGLIVSMMVEIVLYIIIAERVEAKRLRQLAKGQEKNAVNSSEEAVAAHEEVLVTKSPNKRVPRRRKR